MTVLRLTASDDVVAAVRGAAGESIVVVLAGDSDPLSLAMARAAIVPLAIERAPDTRVNAVIADASSDPADVAAAIQFLENALSTTGQSIDLA